MMKNECFLSKETDVVLLYFEEVHLYNAASDSDSLVGADNCRVACKPGAYQDKARRSRMLRVRYRPRLRSDLLIPM